MDLLGLANYAVFMAILIGIYALLALGLNIQWGFTGLFNAGIAGFFAVGAYTSAILTSLPASGRLGGYELPLLVGWLASMAAAAAIAWPIGKICLRFRSDYLAIATIGIAEIIRLVIRTEAGSPAACAASPASRAPSASSTTCPRRSPTWASSPPWCWWPTCSSSAR